MYTRYFVGHKKESRNSPAVELAAVADSDSVDSQEEQGVSVDNICYMKLASEFSSFNFMFVSILQ